MHPAADGLECSLTLPQSEPAMRTFLLCSALLLAIAPVVAAAPALGDKPPKWEYAELTFRNIPARLAGTDADGKEIPATPASVSIRWINPTGEVEVKGWDELADKLKAPALKKGTAAYQKIQILNHLGGEGWELMEQTGGSAAALLDGPGPRGPRGPGAFETAPGFRPGSATGTWLLKRRVP
jgi:hypothetical protein